MHPTNGFGLVFSGQGPGAREMSMHRAWWFLIGFVVLAMLGVITFNNEPKSPRWVVVQGAQPILIDQLDGDTWVLGVSKDGRPQWGLIRR